MKSVSDGAFPKLSVASFIDHTKKPDQVIASDYSEINRSLARADIHAKTSEVRTSRKAFFSIVVSEIVL